MPCAFQHGMIKRVFVGASLAIAGFLSGCGRDTPLPKVHELAAKLTGNHHFNHFVLIVLENEDAAVVDSVPYMDSLARRGVLLRNYYAVAHPSYPNYLALVSGHTFIAADPKVRPDPVAYRRQDLGDAQLMIDAPTVADGFQALKSNWDAFAEDYPDTSKAPTTCDFRRNAGLYTRKHFPFLSFREFHVHPDWCAHVRNLKWFRQDSLADYTFIAPNLVHDGHDAPLTTAVGWLRGFLKPMLADSALMGSTLVVITFDESANPVSQAVFGSSRPNIVYAVLVGGMTNAGTVSNEPYSHLNLLRTVEANFGLSPSLLPNGTPAIDGVWR